jgi:hypothetical protein
VPFNFPTRSAAVTSLKRVLHLELVYVCRVHGGWKVFRRSKGVKNSNYFVGSNHENINLFQKY